MFRGEPVIDFGDPNVMRAVDDMATKLVGGGGPYEKRFVSPRAGGDHVLEFCMKGRASKEKFAGYVVVGHGCFCRKIFPSEGDAVREMNVLSRSMQRLRVERLTVPVCGNRSEVEEEGKVKVRCPYCGTIKELRPEEGGEGSRCITECRCGKEFIVTSDRRDKR